MDKGLLIKVLLTLIVVFICASWLGILAITAVVPIVVTFTKEPREYLNLYGWVLLCSFIALTLATSLIALILNIQIIRSLKTGILKRKKYYWILLFTLPILILNSINNSHNTLFAQPLGGVFILFCIQLLIIVAVLFVPKSFLKRFK